MHTPASFDWRGGDRFRNMTPEKRIEAADACLAALEATDVAVFATQDHCTFDGYALLAQRIAARPGLFTKTLLPGIELRLDAPTPERLNYHIIFSPTIPPERLDAFLHQLKLLKDKSFTRHDLLEYAKSLDEGKKRELGIAAGNHPTDDDYLEAAYKAARVTRESVYDALDKLGPNAGVIMLPYSTSGGFEKLDWKKHPAEDQVYLHRAHIFEARKAAEIALFRGEATDDNKDILSEFLTAIGGKPKACVSGTDAHSLTGYGEYPSGQCTWIRSDPTFQGLLHAVLEPRDRVFIGEKPPKIGAVESYPGKFLESVTIRRDAAAVASIAEKWFDVQMPLNPGLTAIIGNKGSGKSALADVLALLGNAHCTSFSFLNDKRFKKKPDRSLGFKGQIGWCDGTSSERRLSEPPDLASPERVRYLPQERIEELCNEIVAEGRDARFEEELRAVVFAHVPVAERLGASDLDGLIDRRSAGITAEIEELRTSVGVLNRTIADLETRIAPEAVTRLTALVAQKEAEVAALDAAKPPLVSPPAGSGDAASQSALAELTAAQAALKTAADQLLAANSRRAGCVTKQVASKSLLDRLAALEQTLARIEREMAIDLGRAGLVFADLVTVTINRDPLVKLQTDMTSELDAIDTSIGASKSSGLTKAVEDASAVVAALQAKLDAPMQQHQASLAAIAEWQKKRDALVGTATAADTLEHSRAALRYLQVDAPTALASARQEREKIARSIISAIDRGAGIKRDLYSPVQRFLEGKSFDHSRLHLEFTVTSAVNRFAPDFLGMLNQGKAGSFMGIDDGKKVLDEILSRHVFDTEDHVVAFVTDILDALSKDRRGGEPRNLGSQLRKERTSEDLYNLLFKFDWLRPHYALQLDGKPISLLSPGEKGALLIVFYLLLDPTTTPLIIDQPEHNLDNESIMHLLVPCFREAARRRQVIVVTHNPNLAVVADADQVIHARIDRKDGHRIDYTSGSLESEQISKLAVNVLEGTLPAFQQRGEVYELVVK